MLLWKLLVINQRNKVEFGVFHKREKTIHEQLTILVNKSILGHYQQWSFNHLHGHYLQCYFCLSTPQLCFFHLEVVSFMYSKFDRPTKFVFTKPCFIILMLHWFGDNTQWHQEKTYISMFQWYNYWLTTTPCALDKGHRFCISGKWWIHETLECFSLDRIDAISFPDDY